MQTPCINLKTVTYVTAGTSWCEVLKLHLLCRDGLVNFDDHLVQWFLIGGTQRMIEILEIIAIFLGLLEHFLIVKRWFSIILCMRVEETPSLFHCFKKITKWGYTIILSLFCFRKILWGLKRDRVDCGFHCNFRNKWNIVRVIYIVRKSIRNIC